MRRREFLCLLGSLALTGCAGGRDPIPTLEATKTLTPRKVEATPMAVAVTEEVDDGCSNILGGKEGLSSTWKKYKGSPRLIDGNDGKELNLPERADIQSHMVYEHGTLRGVISADWTTIARATDSSFGFERWVGSGHYGIIFKADGTLTVVNPDMKITNHIFDWEHIRESKEVEFSLNWDLGKVTLMASGNGHEGSTSYSGNNIPFLPLVVRLHAQDKEEFLVKKLEYCR